MKQEEVLRNVSTSVFLHCIPYKLMTVTTSFINHKSVKWPNQSELVDTNVAFHNKKGSPWSNSWHRWNSESIKIFQKST